MKTFTQIFTKVMKTPSKDVEFLMKSEKYPMAGRFTSATDEF
jgi:hypothetical protein